MEEIWKYLRSPGWWFTAGIMALIINIAAGYSKEWLDRYVWSKLLPWRRARRAEKRRRYEDEMAFLVAHPTLIALHAFRALFSFAFLGLTLLVAFLFPVVVNATLSLRPYSTFWFGMDAHAIVFLGGVMPLVFLLLAFPLGYFTGIDLGTSMEAFSRLRNRLREIAKSHQ